MKKDIAKRKVKMKQKKIVSMIGALVLTISAVVLITGCPQPNGNKDNNTVNNGGNTNGVLDGGVFKVPDNGNINISVGERSLYWYFFKGVVYEFEFAQALGTWTKYKTGITYQGNIISFTDQSTGIVHTVTPTIKQNGISFNGEFFSRVTDQNIINTIKGLMNPTPSPDPSNPSPDPSETLKEGVYIGILSFDETTHVLTEKPILLDWNGKNKLKEALNQYRKATASGTLLYYTVHKALSTLRGMDAKLPKKMTSCNIITFTDGIDVGSTSPILWNNSPLDEQDFGGKMGDEYLTWLHEQLKTTKIKNQAITASAYGVAGNDVSDQVSFAANLKKLTSENGESNTTITFEQLSTKFGELAKNLNVVNKKTSFDLLITPPTTGNETVYKMTFDDIGYTPEGADNSQVYFMGKYTYADGKYTLSDITYQGIKDAGSSVNGIVEGTKIKFHFDSFALQDGEIVPDNIQQWFKKSSDPKWQRNSEYDQSNTTTSTVDKSSAVIYLVLDSSKSLTDDNVDKIRTASINFIDVLYERYTE